eukprot:ANDGO_01751.mRNA.1 hypothetical protein
MDNRGSQNPQPPAGSGSGSSLHAFQNLLQQRERIYQQQILLIRQSNKPENGPKATPSPSSNAAATSSAAANGMGSGGITPQQFAMLQQFSLQQAAAQRNASGANANPNSTGNATNGPNANAASNASVMNNPLFLQMMNSNPMAALSLLQQQGGMNVGLNAQSSFAQPQPLTQGQGQTQSPAGQFLGQTNPNVAAAAAAALVKGRMPFQNSMNAQQQQQQQQQQALQQQSSISPSGSSQSTSFMPQQTQSQASFLSLTDANSKMILQRLQNGEARTEFNDTSFLQIDASWGADDIARLKEAIRQHPFVSGQNKAVHYAKIAAMVKNRSIREVVHKLVDDYVSSMSGSPFSSATALSSAGQQGGRQANAGMQDDEKTLSPAPSQSASNIGAHLFSHQQQLLMQNNNQNGVAQSPSGQPQNPQASGNQGQGMTNSGLALHGMITASAAFNAAQAQMQQQQQQQQQQQAPQGMFMQGAGGAAGFPGMNGMSLNAALNGPSGATPQAMSFLSNPNQSPSGGGNVASVMNTQNAASNPSWMQLMPSQAPQSNTGSQSVIGANASNPQASQMGQGIAAIMASAGNDTSSAANTKREELERSIQRCMQENIRIIASIRDNLCNSRLEDNFELMVQFRSNVSAILTRMSQMGGVMSQMPAIPVRLNTLLMPQPKLDA